MHEIIVKNLFKNLESVFKIISVHWKFQLFYNNKKTITLTSIFIEKFTAHWCILCFHTFCSVCTHYIIIFRHKIVRMFIRYFRCSLKLIVTRIAFILVRRDKGEIMNQISCLLNSIRILQVMTCPEIQLAISRLNCVLLELGNNFCQWYVFRCARNKMKANL